MPSWSFSNWALKCTFLISFFVRYMTWNIFFQFVTCLLISPFFFFHKNASKLNTVKFIYILYIMTYALSVLFRKILPCHIWKIFCIFLEITVAFAFDIVTCLSTWNLFQFWYHEYTSSFIWSINCPNIIVSQIDIFSNL